MGMKYAFMENRRGEAMTEELALHRLQQTGIHEETER